jgi:hypothetical protein
VPSLANRVTLLLKDGRTLSEELGTRENPRIGLDDADIEAKFRDFARECFTGEQTDRALGLCWSFEQQPTIGAFLSAFDIHANA